VDEFEQAGRELLDVVMDEYHEELESCFCRLVARWKVHLLF